MKSEYQVFSADDIKKSLSEGKRSILGDIEKKFFYNLRFNQKDSVVASEYIKRQLDELYDAAYHMSINKTHSTAIVVYNTILAITSQERTFDVISAEIRAKYRGLSFYSLAYIHVTIHEYKSGAIYFQEAAKQFAKVDKKYEVLLSQCNCAFSYYLLGDYEESFAHAQAAIKMLEDVNVDHVLVSCIYNINSINALRLGKTDLAFMYLEKHLHIHLPISTLPIHKETETSEKDVRSSQKNRPKSNPRIQIIKNINDKTNQNSELKGQKELKALAHSIANLLSFE